MVALLFALGCSSGAPADAGPDARVVPPAQDAATVDGATLDGATPDGATLDAGPSDGGDPVPSGVVLGVSGRDFTIDGVATFLLAASYYGGVGAAPDIVTSDLDRLHALGFNNVRVWASWLQLPVTRRPPLGDTTASVVRPDGTLDPSALARLVFLVDAARTRGITLDVTFMIGIEGISDGGFARYMESIEAVATALLPYRNVFFDLGNEHTVDDFRNLTPNHVGELTTAVRTIDPERLLTASLGGASPEESATDYLRLYPASEIDFSTPHFNRDAGWGAATAGRVETLRGALAAGGWDRPIHLQEEARRSYRGSDWSKGEFLASLAGAVRAGAAGWCFHTGAGFELGEASFFDQLDAVEIDTIDEFAGELSEPMPMPGVVFDVDLTLGSAGEGVQTGGVWDGGWRVTGSGQRIVYDAGRQIRNGYIETTFTIDQVPYGAVDSKNDFFGAYESSTLRQGDVGSLIYVRQGRTGYDFLRWKAGYGPMADRLAEDEGFMEIDIGRVSDWTTDDLSVHTVRLTWRDGLVFYDGTGEGRRVVLHDKLGSYPIHNLRYAFLGLDHSYDGRARGVIGLRFLSFRMVDLGD